MKKNLLSILVLALLLVNIAMTTVMMISVTGTNQKTGELITNIATVLNLELYNPGGAPVAEVALADTDVYDMAELMVPLKRTTTVAADGSTAYGKQTYIMFTPSLFQNKNHEDYAIHGGADKMAGYASAIQDLINQVVNARTMDECQEDLESLKEEILAEVQKLFDSNFIFKIGLNGIKFSN